MLIGSDLLLELHERTDRFLGWLRASIHEEIRSP